METKTVSLALPVPSHSRYTTLLSDIEKGEIKIPQFQRDFGWSIQKSAALIDSIIKAYPIGTFIFWDTKERLRSVRSLGNVALPDAKDGNVVSFVLDGQQRLTSLFATLRGLTVEREPGVFEDFSEVYESAGSGCGSPSAAPGPVWYPMPRARAALCGMMSAVPSMAAAR
jgi:hypothetical protein